MHHGRLHDVPDHQVTREDATETNTPRRRTRGRHEHATETNTPRRRTRHGRHDGRTRRTWTTKSGLQMWTTKSGLQKVDYKCGLQKVDYKKWTTGSGLQKVDDRKWTTKSGLQKRTTGSGQFRVSVSQQRII
ncbi:hypothetical protein NL108_018539 [Boleophthalmus pectinirostris]|nr:hypothetical protein NL108_018539 [Boleophthalmus pectinirostris]